MIKTIFIQKNKINLFLLLLIFLILILFDYYFILLNTYIK